MLALSTAWLAGTDRLLDETFALLAWQGIRAYELNHVVHPLDMDMIHRCRLRYELEFSSLHNICSAWRRPLAPDDHYGDNLASLDEKERRQSCDHLRSTAEAALGLDARAVVIHAGSVKTLQNDLEYKELRRSYLKGHLHKRDMQANMRRRLAERKIAGQPYLQQSIKSLSEVCAEFPELRFGVECRYHYYSLPDIDELQVMRDAIGLRNVGYWHDCGHAEVQEALGLARHEEWLQRYADCLVGVHFHGMKDPLYDHAAPAAGNMPFAMIARYLQPATIMVMELASFNHLNHVLAGKAFLEGVIATENAHVMVSAR